jgi:hypothetical protein
MLEDFLDRKLCINITEYDIPLLHELQEILILRWVSGNSLNSEYTKKLIKDNNNTIYLRCSHSYLTYAREAYGMPCICIRTFISDQKRLEFEEEDLVNLLGD